MRDLPNPFAEPKPYKKREHSRAKGDPDRIVTPDGRTAAEFAAEGNAVQIKRRKELKKSRTELSTAFYDDFIRVWQDCGESALRRAQFHDPMGFVKVAASLMPKQLDVTTTTVQEMEDEQLERLLTLVTSALGERSAALEEEAGGRAELAAPAGQVVDLQALPQADGVPREGD